MRKFNLNLKFKRSNEKWNLFHRTLFTILVLSLIDVIIIGLFIEKYKEIIAVSLIFYIHCIIAIISAIVLYLDIERINKLKLNKRWN